MVRRLLAPELSECRCLRLLTNQNPSIGGRPPCRRRLRPPDRDDQFRAALLARLFPDAAVADKSLGPRCFRFRRCHPESAVGHRSTVRRRRLPIGSAQIACSASAPCFMRSASRLWLARPHPRSSVCQRACSSASGLSGCSFNIVLGAFGKLLPEKWRSLAFGAGTRRRLVRAVPLIRRSRVALMDKFGWQQRC